MLVELTSGQVADRWEYLRHPIMRALPPTIAVDAATTLNRLLEAVLRGHLTVWVGFDKDKPVLVSTTKPVYDDTVGQKNLLIYTLSGLDGMNSELWVEALQDLKLYARANDCHKIIAYTEKNKVTELVTELGGRVPCVLVEFDTTV